MPDGDCVNYGGFPMGALKKRRFSPKWLETGNFHLFAGCRPGDLITQL